MNPKEYAQDLVERMNSINHDKQKSVKNALFVAEETMKVSEHLNHNITLFWREIKKELEGMIS